MREKVYITDPIPDEALRMIDEYFDYECWHGEGKIPKEELIRCAADAVGIINDLIPIDKEILAALPKLRVVSNMSVGYNNLDVKTMKARGILGTNTPGVLNDSVADLVVGLMLATARRIPEMDRYVKNGEWQLKDYVSTFGVDVHHSTVGIIGMGRIGEVVAKRMRMGFDAEVLYCNRTRKPEVERSIGVQYCSMKELLERADFVVLLTPLTAQTQHLIGMAEFVQMKKTAIFINASRGNTVDERALTAALREGRIRAAGLDVFQQEPVEPDNELLHMPNVITMPHIGTATHKTTEAMAMLAVQNLIQALLLGTAPNVVPELVDCQQNRVESDGSC